MNNRKKTIFLKESFMSMTILAFFIIIFAAFLMPLHVLGGEKYDINSPSVGSIADKLSMDGHEEHDLATCVTKQRYYEEIAELLNEDYSEEDVIDYYVEMYGEKGLRAPNKSGFSLLAWTLPFIAMGVVGVGLVVKIKNKAKAHQPIYEEELSLDETEEEVISTYIDEERKKFY